MACMRVGDEGADIEAGLHEALHNHLLTLAAGVLGHEHPLPLHAIKLLAAVLGARPSYASAVLR